MNIDPLVVRIRGLATSRARVLIGVAGAPGSGKTTLALGLVHALAGREDWRDSPAAHVPMDGFHLADTELARLGRRDYKGAPDTFDPGGYAALLARCAAGDACWAPGFERDLEQPLAQALPVTAAARFVIGEGNYLLRDAAPWRAVREQFDEVWFCRMPEALRRARLIARHVRFGKSPEEAAAWVARVDDANAALVSDGAERADLVIDVP